MSAARVALGAVAPTALLVPDAGAALVGSKLDEAALTAMGNAAKAACRPIDDKRGTIDYRIAMSAVYARRAAVIGSELMRSNAAIGSPARVAERIGELADAGADTVYLHIYDIHDLDHIALLGTEVLPHLASVPRERTGAAS